MTDMQQLTVNRSAFAQTELITRPAPNAGELAEGEVLLGVDRFALTANNISYAATGDLLGYWNFFPAASATMGIIPVWGFADVVLSKHGSIEVGERIYGYFPMATHLVVQPDHVNSGSFVDATAHRSGLPLIYNQYLRSAGDALYTRETEPLQMLLRPLFTTSFLLDDFMEDNAFFGAANVVLTSASSKTALGMAYLLQKNRAARDVSYQVVGLTSVGNREFVEQTGCYDRVVCYDELEALGGDETAVVVDFAGNAGLLARVHELYGGQLQYSCQVGASHWEQMGASNEKLVGPDPVMFFAPTQAQKRVAQWGAAVFQQRLATVWAAFIEFVEPRMQIEFSFGPESVENLYQQVLAGSVSPQTGHIASLYPPDSKHG